MASSVDNSRGSRRPDDDKQWAHARLQAYVNSHVKQMGALRPFSKRSRREELAATDNLRRYKTGKREFIARLLGFGDMGRHGSLRRLVMLKVSDD
jgi:hypothetical protein